MAVWPAVPTAPRSAAQVSPMPGWLPHRRRHAAVPGPFLRTRCMSTSSCTASFSTLFSSLASSTCARR